MINDILKDAEERMKKSLVSLEAAFNKIRTGRAHPGILDSIRVSYYGSEMPIQQVANVVVEDAAFATDLHQRLVHAMQHAGRRMDPARYAGRPLRQRVLDRVAFGLMRLALWITGNRYCDPSRKICRPWTVLAYQPNPRTSSNESPEVRQRKSFEPPSGAAKSTSPSGNGVSSVLTYAKRPLRSSATVPAAVPSLR